MMKFTRITLDGMTAYEATGEYGDSYVSVIKKDTKPFESASIIAYVEGFVELSRELGDRSPEYVENSLRGEGGLSCDYYVPNMPRGAIRYTVKTPTFRYYCLTDPLLRALNGKGVRIAAGASSSIPVGRRVFLAIGKVKIGTKTFTAPCQFLVKSKVASIKAVTDSVLVSMELYE